MRFLIPVLPLLALAAAVGVVELIGGLRQSRRAMVYRVALVAALVLVAWTDRRHLRGSVVNLGRHLSA
jgi:hypothetical protein